MTNENESLTSDCKKVKTDKFATKKHTKYKDMSEIITLIKLTTDEKRIELISSYIKNISEFIIHKAEEICKADKRKTVSAGDIKDVIISENLFFLSDLIDLCK